MEAGLYKYGEKTIKKLNFELWEKINLIPFNIHFKEKFFLYENNLKEAPLCYCGNKVKFIDMINGYRRYCSRKCSMSSSETKEKRKKTNIKKWGVDNPSKSEIIKEKVKTTNRKKFGVDYPLQNPEILKDLKDKFTKKYGEDNPSKVKEVREKAKQTNLEKWGFENAMQSNEIKEKLKNYFITQYGVDNPFKLKYIQEKAKKKLIEKWGKEPLKNEIIREKAKQTSLKNWKTTHPTKNEEIKEKRKNTNLKKWGTEVVSKNEKIKEKIKEKCKSSYDSEKIKKSNLKKFNVDHITKNENFRKQNYSISKDINYLKYLKNGVSLFKCDLGLDHTFEINIDNYLKRNNSNNNICTICFPIGDNPSLSEHALSNYIKSVYKGDVIKNYKDKFEIDVYLPDLNIGFEFNGLYWHSDNFINKNYHLNKLEFFKEKNIRIINIWEDDWIFKNEIIKSMVANFIGKSKKIGARKCIIKEITDNKLIRDFLNKNHIQGFVGSNIKLGLFHNDELVSLMTFDKNEGRKKMDKNNWNISRFCNKLNYSVVGSASKLLNYFIMKYKPKTLISYADKSWSFGDLYYKLGFKLVKNIRPDYKYIINDKRVNKSKFRKSNLNTELSESQFMSSKMINKIWDCGKLKFEY